MAVCVGGSESSEVAEIVDVASSDEDGDVTEVRTPRDVPPLRFRGYRRGRELGRGVSGQVFVCNCGGRANRKGFAVKVVNLKRLQLRPNAEREEEKLHREVAILRKLPPHPNIVQLKDSFKEGHWFMIVLELVGGGDLFTALTARTTPRLQEGEAAFVLVQLVEGLDFLHCQSIIHRDVKLENVLVASQQKQRHLGLVLYGVKITDFGLSKDVGLGRSGAQSTVGSRPYTSPEVLREGPHDFSSDLWCLGVLLYVLLVGHFPYDQLPDQQSDCDRIVEGFSGSTGSRAVLNGFLQMEPSQRLSLEAVRCHDWLQDLAALEGPEQPQKKQRTATADSNLSEFASPEEMLPQSSAVVIEGSPDFTPEPKVAINESARMDISANETVEIPGGIASLGIASPGGLVSPGGLASLVLEDWDFTTNSSNLRGVWTPFAVEASIQLSEVRPPSASPDVVQVHMVTPDRLAGFILGKHGTRIKQIALDSGSQVWMTKRDGDRDRRVIMLGTYKQCKAAQEFVHEQLAIASKSDWRDTEAEVVLFVRAEAAGVVTGKRGFVLNQIKKQSGAKIQLLREEVEGQRPCIITGMLQKVLRAEKHVFDLVRAVPTTLHDGDAVAPCTVVKEKKPWVFV